MRFVPPYVLETLAETNPHARETLAMDAATRVRRQFRTPPGDGGARVVIWDSRGTYQTRLTEAGADDPATEDSRRAAAFARDWIQRSLGRNGYDSRNSSIHVNIHYGTDYQNAFWDGDELVLGDGDGSMFVSFAGSPDVIAHEIAHGLVQHAAGLSYRDQPGALNEHFADVFGSAIEQALTGDSAETADWLVGDEITGPDWRGRALRSMAYPGTAYAGDPQPAHMDDLYTGSADNGGVHINSGIPNRVFHAVAMRVGTQDAARLWYVVLLNLWPTADFLDFAKVLGRFAKQREMSAEVVSALDDVGLNIGGET